jgi:hypothetical protein
MTVSTIKLKATNGGGSVALKGVANTAHDVELEMPSDIGTADQYLKLTSISGKTGTLAWQSAQAGATGGGTDQVFYENGQTVTTNYTITNNTNAMSAGPVTINSGITVEIGSGENWIII